MEWIIERLSEPSTWRGIVALASVAGFAMSPDQSAQIIAAGIAIAGVINVFRKEK